MSDEAAGFWVGVGLGRLTPLPLLDEGTGSAVLSIFSDKVLTLEFSALKAPVVVVYWSWIDLHIVPTAFSGVCRTVVISEMALRVRSLASPTTGGVEQRVVRAHRMERSVEQTRGQRQTGRNDLPGMGERVA